MAAPPLSAEASPLQEVVRFAEGGAYAGEVLCRHVRLGPAILACTDARVLYLRAGSWNVQWQVPLDQIKGVEIQRDKSRVLIQTFGSRQPTAIDCGHVAVCGLVYSTLQEVRTLRSEALMGTALMQVESRRAAPALARTDIVE
mmetsp:Transcript_14383/g.32853  ORF Transcript_14383/g.32853 Transcript_14383/m.32853 type:complete len:143 (-) Transcript_14383:73-501(-)